MSQNIKWGIIGLGNIAHKFASDLQLIDGAVLQGVASRSIDKAVSFAKQYKAKAYYDNYQQLAVDPDIDIVYIATPNNHHFDNTIMCLDGGKSVLCEKPLGLNSQEVQEMIYKARSKKLFLMEGLWTRFIPAIQKMLEFLDQEVIGDLISIRADFGFQTEFDANSRLFNKQLGGGSLLDIGIYPIYLSYLVFGFPIDIKALAKKTSTSVDQSCEMLLRFQKDRLASLTSTFEAHTTNEAIIYGTKGKIKLYPPFHHPQKISVIYYNGQQDDYNIPLRGNGYIHEIEAVNASLQQNHEQNASHSLQNSLDIMKIIDQIKHQINLSYS